MGNHTSKQGTRLPEHQALRWPKCTIQVVGAVLLSVGLWGGSNQRQAAIATVPPPNPAAQPSPTLAVPPRSPQRLSQSVRSPTLKQVLTGKPVAGIVTSQTIALTRLTPPSLWWIANQLASEEQYGNKFIQEWVAYPLQTGQPGRLDLLVNRQQWSLMDYLERYEFIHRFGAVARGYGYNTRIYDNPDNGPIALAMCQFSPLALQIAQTLLAQPGTPSNRSDRGTRRAVFDDLPCEIKIESALKSTRQRLLERLPQR